MYLCTHRMNCLSLVEILLVITQQITGMYMHALAYIQSWYSVLHNWCCVADAAEAIAFLETFLDKVC